MQSLAKWRIKIGPKYLDQAFLIVPVVLSAHVLGQSPPIVRPIENSPAEYAEALNRVAGDNIGTGIVDASPYIQKSAGVGPTKAIPVLEDFYKRHDDPELRTETARVLVWLGDKENTYWDLLVSLATEAIESDIPSPLATVKSAGKDVMTISPELSRWAKNHHMKPDAAYKEALMDLPDKLSPSRAAVTLKPSRCCGERSSQPIRSFRTWGFLV